MRAAYECAGRSGDGCNDHDPMKQSGSTLTGMEPWFKFWSEVGFALRMLRQEWRALKAYESDLKTGRHGVNG